MAEPAAGDDGHGSHDHHTDTHADTADAGHGVGGLEATYGGYTLEVLTDGAAALRGPLAFRVLGPDGEAVTAYDEEHERDLHLVVVRRDLTGFQHVHPTLDASGVWSVPVDLAPGAWRVLADLHPTGAERVVLGADLLVPGRFDPQPLGADSSTASVEGYDVTLGRAVVGAGTETVLTATVSRGGEPVADLQPYLGAHGHLVSLREGDLGLTHVHPEPGGPGPSLSFRTSFPTAGRYRLFLDFRHDDVVRTVAFTVTLTDTAPADTDTDTATDTGTDTATETGDGGAAEDGHDH